MSLHRILNEMSVKYGMTKTLEVYDNFNKMYRNKHFLDLINNADKFVRTKNNVFERYVRMYYRS